ncbi:outer membrane protein [Roseitranquillus sediminis]|uniref:outer membrane protein n=1 Tax=Roseitranquillus sediminis TaxID=2809051 RepID=UPI001D0C15B0|nr:outer membrane beta-barrel protein [Roseitranquillus sediminis]MBM9595749.1 porin family protein [Roseitranquillus sediminis]
MAKVAGTLAVVLAVGLAAPAWAAGPFEPAPDPVVSAPAPAPAPVIVNTDWSGPYFGAQLGWGRAEADGDEGDGLIGGLTGGYRQDLGRFVLGGELQYDWADIDLEDDAGQLDDVFRVKGIAGYDAGRALIYGSAGWARASGEVAGDSAEDHGWLLGAGVDYLVRDNVAVGGEVTHHSFDDFDDSGTDIDATTLNARVTFRF